MNDESPELIGHITILILMGWFGVKLMTVLSSPRKSGFK